MKAYAYVRVSTAKQSEEGVSLEAQQERIRAWCQAQGHELAATETDAGLSGGRADNRPALKRALDAVCKARGVLVVYDLSRLARSLPDAVRILERLTKAGARLACLVEGIDTSTATGELVYGIMCSVNQFVARVGRERTRDITAYKQANGEYTGGEAPYGQMRVIDEKTVSVNLDEQRVVRMIRQLSGLHGLKAGEIARRLNSANVPCRGSAWHAKSVARILGRSA